MKRFAASGLALSLALWAVMAVASAQEPALTRWEEDVAAMAAHRPGYAFSMTPQAMRAPAFPAGSVFMSSAAA